jgi:hypothetical protein
VSPISNSNSIELTTASSHSNQRAAPPCNISGYQLLSRSHQEIHSSLNGKSCPEI